MLIKSIQTGDQVLLSHVANTAKRPYTTRVEVVETDETILIHEPREKGKRINFVAGNAYRLSFLSDGSVVNFDAKLAAIVRIDGFNMLRFQLIDKGEKVQRRNAFRFACLLPATFNLVNDSGEQGPLTEGLIRDLSGGGIKLAAAVNLPVRSLLRLDLTLGDDYVMAFGLVLMRKHEPGNEKYPFQYGIKFEALPESDEERIVRFVYNEQRKLLKRPQRSLYKTPVKK